MPKVIIEALDNIAILRLNNGVTNAISPSLVEEMSEAIVEVKKNFNGMILTGGGKFFSIGLDLPALLTLNRTELTDFWFKFNQLTLDLFTIPMPTAAVLSGHAIAGGNIFALTTDFRFGTSDRRQIGLNEVRLGLPAPYLADLMLRQVVGDRHATGMLYHGGFITFQNAKDIGLIDVICSPETVEEEAVKKITELAALPASGFAAIKANRVEATQLRYQENYRSKNDEFLDCWFSDSVQALLKEAAKKF